MTTTPLPEFAGLLGDLAGAFGEPVTWNGHVFLGRFRIDPFVVTLPGNGSGLGATETWVYCERAIIPGPVPDTGAVLLIRGRGWEVVEVGEDDLGELALRLIKYDGTLPALPGPGRPTRREEIVQAYETVAGRIAPDTPMSRLYPEVRRFITGSPEPAPGLTDKTLGAALRPVIAARRTGR